MKNQIGYTIFFVSAVVACWALRMDFDQKASATEHPTDAVGKMAEAMVSSGKLTGLSVGIVSMDSSGKLQKETLHFGHASDSGQLPDDDTIYEIGGLSNVFTSILLATSVANRELSLDTAVNEIMPSGITMPAYDGRNVSLLDLVTHRSGLPRIADNMPMAKLNDPYFDYTSKLAGEFLNSYTLSRAPGSKYEYSNFGMAYLGHLLTTNSSAKDYDAVLSERITGPLKMASTAVQLGKVDPSKVADGHSASGRKVSSWTWADMPGAGGLNSTIADMNRFMAAQLNAPSTNLGKAIDLAFETKVDPLGKEFAMGLGWLISRDGETRFHNGQTGGFHAAMFVNRQLNLGICVLSNTASSDVTALAERIIQQKARTQTDTSTVEGPAEMDSEVSRETMGRYVGRYQLAPTFIFDVRRDGDKLMVGITNQATQRVYPRNQVEWHYKGVKAALLFGDIKNGKAMSVTLLQNGLRQKAARIVEETNVSYRKLSPFSAVRWQDAIPQVQVKGTWYEFVSLNDHVATDILDFSRAQFGNRWKKRFEEDLVELLTRMGHPPQNKVNLILKSLHSEERKTFEDIVMTRENRRAIYKAAQNRS